MQNNTAENIRRMAEQAVRQQEASRPAAPESLEELQEMVEYAKETIAQQEHLLARLAAKPLAHATVVKVDNTLRPERFESGDRVLVLDKNSVFYQRVGKIISEGVANGQVRVEFWGVSQRPLFNIGLDGQEPQVKLLLKNDGTNIVVAFEGRVFEVWGSPEFAHAKPTDVAKVNLETNQVVEIVPNTGLGVTCKVSRVIDPTLLEVDANGTKKVIHSALEGIEEGDDVVTDPSLVIATRGLPKPKNKYAVDPSLKVTWDDIAGCDEAKLELKDAIEGPIKEPEVFAFYHEDPPKGIVLEGPPGNGKTLLGKAAAHALAQMYNKEVSESGFRYIKGPEMLSMWVGENEREVRTMFKQMRQHFEKNGYPAVAFVDEADSIVLSRSGGNTSFHEPWRDTLVGAWLAEMDGFDYHHGIFIFATNRPGKLDGAFVRPGRIDKHIKVPRPTVDNAPAYFQIHLRNVPLAGITAREAIAISLAELTSAERCLYKVKHMAETELFTFKHLLSGAMVKNIVQGAKAIARRRDVAAGTKTGVKLEDFQQAVEKSYRSQIGLNHQYDLIDFCETKGWDYNKCEVELIAKRT